MLTTDVAGWLYRRPQQTLRVAQIQREPCHTKSSATVRLFQTPTAAAAAANPVSCNTRPPVTGCSLSSVPTGTRHTCKKRR